MALYVVRLVEPLRFDLPLSQGEEGRTREALRLVRRFLDDYGPYATLLRNYMELDDYLETLDREFRDAPAGLRAAQELDRMMLEVNRLTMNFLASARSFLDIYPRRLRAFAAQTERRFASWCSVQYESSVSYRVFENLRNVSQHRDLPVRAYRAAQTRCGDGSIEVNQQLMIDRLAFMDAGIQAPVRAELALWNDNIPVHEHLRRYFEGLGLVQLQSLRDIVPTYEPCADLIERHLRAAGHPAAVPIYFIERAGPNDARLDLLDPHLHGIALIRGTQVALGQTDFRQLDALAQAHPTWPG